LAVDGDPPHSVRPRLYLAVALAQLGDIEEAENELHQAKETYMNIDHPDRQLKDLLEEAEQTIAELKE
jgi:hypothetical protein